MTDDKKTECIKVWLALPLELELRKMAETDDRKLSDFIGLVLRNYVYGHGARPAEDTEGPMRGD